MNKQLTLCGFRAFRHCLVYTKRGLICADIIYTPNMQI